MTTRVVFLGTPAYALAPLRALLDAPGIAVPLVVTQPDRPAGRGRRPAASPVKAFAAERGVPVFDPERLRGPEVIERLGAAGADLFVIAAYGQLLRPAVLAIPPHGVLNVHPSLLPRYRGPAPVAATILSGDDEGGVTIMLTDRGMDTGPILAQRRIPLDRSLPGGAWTTTTLTPHLFALGADLLLETIPRWLAGRIVPRAQDEGEASVTRLFTTADGALDWTRPAIALERQVRALNPWPRTYTFAGAVRLQVLRAAAVEHGAAYPEPALVAAPPGTVSAEARTGRMVVATGEGLLLVEEVQPEGRRPMDSAIFLRNNQALIGAQLSLTACPSSGQAPGAPPACTGSGTGDGGVHG